MLLVFQLDLLVCFISSPPLLVCSCTGLFVALAQLLVASLERRLINHATSQTLRWVKQLYLGTQTELQASETWELHLQLTLAAVFPQDCVAGTENTTSP